MNDDRYERAARLAVWLTEQMRRHEAGRTWDDIRWLRDLMNTLQERERVTNELREAAAEVEARAPHRYLELERAWRAVRDFGR